uniref:Uncharacterized protein n=1 Tax=Chromera velia CCMP2878 TaxID=1169474 RepID=A0A0G4HXL8_9ALVE|eukprot:Cvel_9290.t1-p1 / transcript=Cvel_9290.t1 / gene=Cvel_9290 / organism=Chromera_velia_CCMP2878 / gene_product=hypothetical protein / transcript_product=hypothetical protein / location=Cvel_scaffold531:73040-74818(+) / protein_length=593 / sequence_SO=supercontig / SO=protein_coding / is_pseudo=false
MSKESMKDNDFVQDNNGFENADSFDETRKEASNKQSNSRPQTAQRPKLGGGWPRSSSPFNASAPLSFPATVTAMPSYSSAHGDRENRESNTNNTPGVNANNGASSNSGGMPGELGLHPERRSTTKSASSLGTSQAAQILEASQYIGAPDSQSEGGGRLSTSNHAATVAVVIHQEATAAMYSRNSLSDSVGGVGVVGGVGDGETETALLGNSGVSRARSSAESKVIPAMAHGKGKGLCEDPHVIQMQPSPDGGMNGSFNEGSRGEDKVDRTSPRASQREEGDISKASGVERSAEESRLGQSSVGADAGLDGEGDGGAVSQSLSRSRGGRDEMTPTVSAAPLAKLGGQKIYTEGVGGIRTGVKPVTGDRTGVWGRSADSMDAPAAIRRPQNSMPGRGPRTCSATRSDRTLTYAEAGAEKASGDGDTEEEEEEERSNSKDKETDSESEEGDNNDDQQNPVKTPFNPLPSSPLSPDQTKITKPNAPQTPPPPAPTWPPKQNTRTSTAAPYYPPPTQTDTHAQPSTHTHHVDTTLPPQQKQVHPHYHYALPPAAVPLSLASRLPTLPEALPLPLVTQAEPAAGPPHYTLSTAFQQAQQ